MFHSGTQQFLHVWSGLPDAGRIPFRRDLRPENLGPLLNRAIMAERRGDAPVVTLAGGWIEQLHGRTLSNRPWLDLWRREDHPQLTAALFGLFREARPIVIAADTGLANGRLEVVLAPLRGPDGAADRLIGLYQPFGPDGRSLRDAPALAVMDIRPVGEARRAPLVLAARNGRLVA